MIVREAQVEIAQLLEEFPAVAVLGPRQVGKTTLAETIATSISPNPVYLDLESPTDQAKLREPEAYFELHKRQLIVLDEIQRVPELFICHLAWSHRPTAKTRPQNGSISYIRISFA